MSAAPLGLTAACLLGALVLHGSTLSHPFISDDKLVVESNPTLARADLVTPVRLLGMNYWAQIDPAGQVQQPSADRNLYRPVTMISFWLNARLTGLTPWGIRLGNVLLHGLCAAAVGLLAAGWAGGAAGLVAAAAVLLHPVGTDVINRVVGRADILVLLGLTLFLLIDRRAAGRQAGGLSPGWSIPRAAGAALAAVVALGAKESGAVLFPLAVAVALTDPARGRTDRRTWIGPLIALGITLSFLAARAAVVGKVDYGQHHGNDLMENPLQWFGFGQRLSPGLALAGYYVRMLVWPWPLLIFDRPAVMPAGASFPVLAGGAVLLLAIAGLAWLVAPRRGGPGAPAWRLALAWWLLSYGIVSQIPLAIGAYREARFVYPFLGSLGLLAAMAWSAPGRPALRRAARGAALLLGLAFVTMVVIRNGEFHDETRILEADVRRAPGAAINHAALGGLYQEAGRMADALKEFEEAVHLAPGSAEAHRDLGSLYVAAGDSTRAGLHLRRALALNPDDPSAIMNLGVLRLRQQRLAEAAELLKRSERLDPGFLQTQLNLGLVEVLQGDFDAANRRGNALERSHPGDPRVMSLRAMIDQARRGAPGPPR